MSPVDDHASGKGHGNRVPQLPDRTDRAESIEAYEAEEGVVLYDAKNPLAWLQSTTAVPLGDRL